MWPNPQKISDLVTFTGETVNGKHHFFEQWKICGQLLENLLLFPMRINPFLPYAPFLYPLKTSENLTVFWCFQGVAKGCIGSKWFKHLMVVLILDSLHKKWGLHYLSKIFPSKIADTPYRCRSGVFIFTFFSISFYILNFVFLGTIEINYWYSLETCIRITVTVLWIY